MRRHGGRGGTCWGKMGFGRFRGWTEVEVCQGVARAPETVGGRRTGPGVGGSVWVPAMTAGSPPVPENRLWHPGPRSRTFTCVPSSLTTRPPRRPQRTFWVRATFQVMFSCSRLTPGPSGASGGSSVAERSARGPDFTHRNKTHARVRMSDFPAHPLVGLGQGRGEAAASPQDGPHAHLPSRALGGLRGAVPPGPSLPGGESGRGPRVALKAFSIACRCWALGLEGEV